MVPYLGDFAEDDTVYMMFNTFSSNDPSASVTITNFINTDVHIHKDDGLTQRNNAAGITVSVDFDGITGSHMIKIDTNDNTVGGFWVTGSEYFVRIEGTTVDAATINAVVGHFSIERAGGVIALLKLIQAAVITNAAGADVAADIIAVKAETATIVNDTDVIDDGTSGLVKIAQDVAAILTDTGTTLDGKLDTIDNFLDTEIAAIVAAVITNAAGADVAADIIAVKAETASILTDTGTTLQGELDGIQADTEDIQARLPAALSSGNIKADALAISTSTDAADKLEASAETIVLGTVSHDNTASTTTVFYSDDITEATADHFNGRIVIFTSGAVIQQATDITDYELSVGEGKFTVTALAEAPADNVTFVIV